MQNEEKNAADHITNFDGEDVINNTASISDDEEIIILDCLLRNRNDKNVNNILSELSNRLKQSKINIISFIRNIHLQFKVLSNDKDINLILTDELTINRCLQEIESQNISYIEVCRRLSCLFAQPLNIVKKAIKTAILHEYFLNNNQQIIASRNSCQQWSCKDKVIIYNYLHNPVNILKSKNDKCLDLQKLLKKREAFIFSHIYQFGGFNNYNPSHQLNQFDLELIKEYLNDPVNQCKEALSQSIDLSKILKKTIGLIKEYIAYCGGIEKLLCPEIDLKKILIRSEKMYILKYLNNIENRDKETTVSCNELCILLDKNFSTIDSYCKTKKYRNIVMSKINNQSVDNKKYRSILPQEPLTKPRDKSSLEIVLKNIQLKLKQQQNDICNQIDHTPDNDFAIQNKDLFLNQAEILIVLINLNTVKYQQEEMVLSKIKDIADFLSRSENSIKSIKENNIIYNPSLFINFLRIDLYQEFEDAIITNYFHNKTNTVRQGILQYIELSNLLEKQINLLKQYLLEIKVIDDNYINSSIVKSFHYKHIASHIIEIIQSHLKANQNKIKPSLKEITELAFKCNITKRSVVFHIATNQKISNFYSELIRNNEIKATCLKEKENILIIDFDKTQNKNYTIRPSNSEIHINNMSRFDINNIMQTSITNHSRLKSTHLFDTNLSTSLINAYNPYDKYQFSYLAQNQAIHLEKYIGIYDLEQDAYYGNNQLINKDNYFFHQHNDLIYSLYSRHITSIKLITPDGDCLFNAILESGNNVKTRISQIIEKTFVDQEDLRDYIANRLEYIFLLKNINLTNGFIDFIYSLFDFNQNREVAIQQQQQHYVEELKKPGKWDIDPMDVVPNLIAEIFGIPMNIYRIDKTKLNIYSIGSNELENNRPLPLIYNGSHYDIGLYDNQLTPTLKQSNYQLQYYFEVASIEKSRILGFYKNAYRSSQQAIHKYETLFKMTQDQLCLKIIKKLLDIQASCNNDILYDNNNLYTKNSATNNLFNQNYLCESSKQNDILYQTNRLFTSDFVKSKQSSIVDNVDAYSQYSKANSQENNSIGENNKNLLEGMSKVHSPIFSEMIHPNPYLNKLFDFNQNLDYSNSLFESNFNYQSSKYGVNNINQEKVVNWNQMQALQTNEKNKELRLGKDNKVIQDQGSNSKTDFNPKGKSIDLLDENQSKDIFSKFTCSNTNKIYETDSVSTSSPNNENLKRSNNVVYQNSNKQIKR